MAAFHKARRTPGTRCLTEAELPPQPLSRQQVPDLDPLENKQDADQLRHQQARKFLKASAWRTFGIYARGSSTEQGGGTTIEGQVRRTVEYLGSRKLPIACIAWDQESGTTYDRPGFEAVLGKARAGTIQGLLVFKMSRFGRNYADGQDLLRELWNLDCPVYFPAEDYFPTEIVPAAYGVPRSRMKALKLLDEAEWDNHDRKSGVLRSMKDAYEDGRYPNGTPWTPLFYELQEAGKGKKKRRWPVLLDNALAVFTDILASLRNADSGEHRRVAVELSKTYGFKSVVPFLNVLSKTDPVGLWSDHKKRWMAPYNDDLRFAQDEDFDELQGYVALAMEVPVKEPTQFEQAAEDHGVLDLQQATAGLMVPYCHDCKSVMEIECRNNRRGSTGLLSDVVRCGTHGRRIVINKAHRQRLAQLADKCEEKWDFFLAHVYADLAPFDLEHPELAVFVAAGIAEAAGVSPPVKTKPQPKKRRTAVPRPPAEGCRTLQDYS